MGLDHRTLIPNAVERAVKTRLHANGGLAERDYPRLLENSPSELQELIETLTIHFTWFFREPGAFRTLREIYLKNLRMNPGKTFHALSVGCATGEEPYSMAITLAETGAGKNNFEVDALDISRVALEEGKKGIFRMESFRNCEPEIRERWFNADAGCFSINESIRSRVNFIPGSVTDLPSHRLAWRYQAIFCRNLLIYMSPEARLEISECLAGLLAPDGVLIVGLAETMSFPRSRFQSAMVPGGFRLRLPSQNDKQKLSGPEYADRIEKDHRSQRSGNAAISKGHESIPLRGKSTGPDLKRITHERENPAKTIPPSHVLKVPAADELGQAKRLADQGLLKEACAACDKMIEKGSRDPQVFVLLGIVSGAMGNAPAAEDACRKALYLQPDNTDALLNLSLILEQRGEKRELQLIKRRMKKAMEAAGHE